MGNFFSSNKDWSTIYGCLHFCILKILFCLANYVRGIINIFGEICAILAALCWVLGASLYKKASHNLPALTFNFARSTLAALYSFLTLFLLGNWNSIFKMDLITIAIMEFPLFWYLLPETPCTLLD